MEWLLRRDVMLELEAIKRAGLASTEAQREAFMRSLDEQRAPRSLKIAGAEAEISIEGVLMESPSFFSYLMARDVTTYGDLRAALLEAETNPVVKRITLAINSPGGQVAGLFETLDVLAQVTKPVKVRAALAASAAYALAAMGGKIEAVSRSSEFGSVGIMATYFVYEEEVTIRNSDSPEKNPDPSTDEGKALIVKRLDSINELFVGAIAKGRTAFSGTAVTGDDVKQNFGRGAVMFASEAKAAGLIDFAPKEPKMARGGVRAEDDTPVEAAAPAIEPAGGGKDESIMDLKTLKATHPELCEALVAEGIKEERDRCEAHLTMGETSGDLKTAIAAIKDGSTMTQTMTAKYLAAGMNKAAVTARQTETAAAAAAVADAQPQPGGGAAPGASEEVERLCGQALDAVLGASEDLE